VCARKQRKTIHEIKYKEDKRDPHLTSLLNKERMVKMEAGEEEQKIRLF
jgi:hypothetical protein